MFGLVFKQLKLQKAYLIIFAVGILSIGGISVFCSLLGKTGAEVDMVSVVLPLFLLLYICADAVSSNFFVPDENKKWAAFIISTPLGARGQVKVQYILTILIMYVTNISCYLIDSISAIVGTGESYGIQTISVMLFYLYVFLKAVELPFVVYFGSKTGNNVKVCVFLGLFFSVGVYALFGDISMFFGYGSFMDWLLNLLADAEGSDVMIIFMSIGQLISLALYYISYRISCRIYAKGAMNYEN